ATAATPTATPAPPATASANAEPRSDAASSSQSVDINAGPAVRRLRPSMYLDFAYLVYNAKLDKRTGLPQLSAQTRLFRDGQPVYTGIPHPLALKQQPDMKRLSVAGRLRLGSNLVPGDYVLQVIITDQLRDGKQRVKSQWIDFEIMTGDK
ncbi:MAG: hypothetical protein ACRD9R_05065, partial [Pyrinomonadaceae bacterium]